MKNYLKIKDIEPVLEKCFFAFSKSQFAEGKAKAGITDDEKILSGIGGLYGTKEGIKKLYDFYDDQAKEIGEKCRPQEVYDYELANHECSYSNDDSQVIEMIIHYFGIEKAKTIKRKFAWKKLE